MANWKGAAEAKRQLLESLNQKKKQIKQKHWICQRNVPYKFFPLSLVLHDFSQERKKERKKEKRDRECTLACRTIWTHQCFRSGLI